jgi:predicted SnoaL-like aldol condensation-catalyzing enzyme
MQKYLVMFAALLVLASCSAPAEKEMAKDENSKAEKNLANARAVANAFQTGNTAAIDTVVADDFLDHTDRGDKKGRDSLKAMINMVHNNMKDMKMEVLRELGDDEYVFQWMRYTGTSDGSMGMPAGPYDMRAIEVSRHDNGKLVEHWAYMDMGEMLKMMGHHMPGGMAPADTTKATK